MRAGSGFVILFANLNPLRLNEPPMQSSDLKLFSASLDVTFPKPIRWTPEIGEFAEKLHDVAGFTIPAGQIRSRMSDTLFDYELSANFFGGNATFSRTAERMVMTLNNGQTPEDARVILEVIRRFGEYAIGRGFPSVLWITSHIGLGGVAERQSFLARFAPDSRVEHAGAVAYVRTDEFEEPVRFLFEPSFSYNDAVFAQWRFVLPIVDDWMAMIQKIMDSLPKVATVYGLEAAQLASP